MNQTAMPRILRKEHTSCWAVGRFGEDSIEISLKEFNQAEMYVLEQMAKGHALSLGILPFSEIFTGSSEHTTYLFNGTLVNFERNDTILYYYPKEIITIISSHLEKRRNTAYRLDLPKD